MAKFNRSYRGSESEMNDLVNKAIEDLHRIHTSVFELCGDTRCVDCPYNYTEAVGCYIEDIGETLDNVRRELLRRVK